MTYIYLSFLSFCLLASVRGDSDNVPCTDRSSSCSTTSDESVLLQSRLGVASDSGVEASDGDGDAVRHGVGVAANKTRHDKKKKTAELQETGGPVSPLISCGKTFYILGRSSVWGGNGFCYKLVMCEILYQSQPAVCGDDWDESCDKWPNERCKSYEKEWKPIPHFVPPLLTYWNTVIGQHPVTSADGLTQEYSDGTKGACQTDDSKRKTALTMVVDDSKTDLSMIITEPKEFCYYHVKVTGPMRILGTTTTTTTTTTTVTTTVTDGPIPPSRSCGQTYYILGESDVQNGNCFCYKLVMCDTLYQHQPTEDCSLTNEKCATAYKDWTPEDAKAFWPPLGTDDYWNTVIGKYAKDSGDKMTQSYTNGTKGSCETEDQKRKTALTMVADNSKKDLSVSVTEPKVTCSYKVKVSGPMSKLLGLQDH